MGYTASIYKSGSKKSTNDDPEVIKPPEDGDDQGDDSVVNPAAPPPKQEAKRKKSPIYKVKKGDIINETLNPDTDEMEKGEWESMGERAIGKDGKIESDVDEEDLRAQKGDIAHKDTENGNRREYFKRRNRPTS